MLVKASGSSEHRAVNEAAEAMHFGRSEKGERREQQPDSDQWRIAPFRLRYQVHAKAERSKRGSQGRARVSNMTDAY